MTTQQGRRYERKTLSTERIKQVRAALNDQFNGVATGRAIGRLTGYKTTSVREALSHLVENGEIAFIDVAFPPPPGKGNRRPLRLHYDMTVEVTSIHDRLRLMTALVLVSEGLPRHVCNRPLSLVSHNPTAGLLIFEDPEILNGDVVIVVVDDESEQVERVARWARQAHRLAVQGELERITKVNHGHKSAGGETSDTEASSACLRLDEAQVIIATCSNLRAEMLRTLSSYTVVNVADERISG